MAVGAGSVWVANSGDGTVTRIDPATDRDQATIRVGGSPPRSRSPAGRAWVTVDAQSLAPSRGAPRRRHAPDRLRDRRRLHGPGARCRQPLLAAAVRDVRQAPQLSRSGRARPARSSYPRSRSHCLSAQPDGKTYTFTIRPGFRFSPPSTELVTAQTFKYTIERTLSRQTRSRCAPSPRPTSSAPTPTWPARPATSRGSARNGEQAHLSAARARAGLPSRIALPALLRGAVEHPDRPARGAGDPIRRTVLRRVVHAGSGRGAAAQPQLSRQSPSPFRADRARGRGPRATRRQPKSRPAPPTTRRSARIVQHNPEHRRLASLAARYGAGSPAAARGHQQYFVNPDLQARLLLY